MLDDDDVERRAGEPVLGLADGLTDLRAVPVCERERVGLERQNALTARVIERAALQLRRKRATARIPADQNAT